MDAVSVNFVVLTKTALSTIPSSKRPSNNGGFTSWLELNGRVIKFFA